MAFTERLDEPASMTDTLAQVLMNKVGGCTRCILRIPCDLFTLVTLFGRFDERGTHILEGVGRKNGAGDYTDEQGRPIAQRLACIPRISPVWEGAHGTDETARHPEGPLARLLPWGRLPLS